MKNGRRRRMLAFGGAGLVAVVAATGTAYAVNAVNALGQITAGSSGFRVDSVRGEVTEPAHGATGWAALPGTQMNITISSTHAPALTLLRWSGEEACSDVCGIRFVVDGNPTHLFYSDQYIYPRDNDITASTWEDHATLSAGTHTVSMQYQITANCASCTGLGIFEMFDWVETSQTSKITATG